MTALAANVTVDTVTYPAGTAHTDMPAAVVDRIRNPAAWVGGTAPALSVVPVGKAHITGADLSNPVAAKAALGITVDLSKGHMVPTGTAPAAAATSAMGTSPSATVAGRDTAGVITLVSGTGSFAAGNQVVVTFAQAFAVAPVVVVCPGGSNSAALVPYVVSGSTSTTAFTVAFASAPSASTTYKVHYVVIGK